MPKLLPIRILGDEILRRHLQEADPQSPALHKIIPDMIHTMYECDGVGLAANQVGLEYRLFVMDPWWAREESRKTPMVLINPEIHTQSGEQIDEEGCISVPDIFANVSRANVIEYSYNQPDGTRIQARAEGYEARVIQHELDHLNGIVFTDRISNLAKLKLKRRLKEIQASAVNGVNIRKDEEL
ncbi:MAG TPA: peptide deformylase [Candidatus Cloacimonadota bacterium]|jgi:peptide deformylase|nr:peptide deformylase [Candidatus Cloacimonadota bacterium]